MILLISLNDQKKNDLLLKIQKISTDFEYTELKSLLREFLILKESVIFSELEQWLKELIEKDLPLAHGILAVLYYSIGDYDNAAFEANSADYHFGKTEIWSNLFEHSILAGAEELAKS